MIFRVRYIYIAFFIFFLFLFIHSPAYTQDTSITLKEAGLNSKLMKWIMENPDTINRKITDIIKEDSPIRKIIDNGNIKLKTFDADTDTGEVASSIGFSYAYSKDINKYDFKTQKAARYTGLVLNFASDGNVAFDKEVNPENFIDTDLSFLFFRSSGGALSVVDTVAQTLNELEDIAAEEPTREEFLKNKATQEAARIIRSHLTTQFYLELSADAGIESDQSFSKKQYYYGLHVGLDVKAWNPDSTMAKLNFLDYPFALTRLLLGNDSKWMPRGSVLPTLLIAIDQVSPKDEEPRKLAGDDSDFARLRFEAAYRSQVGHIHGDATFFEADLRHYQELNPSETLKGLSLDRYTALSLALLLPRGIYISYTTGKLPLDAEEDRIYELGFNYSF